jgi:hypothetical protein
MDVVGGEWVKWFWGLTCDFWAKNAKNNLRDRDVKWIESLIATSLLFAKGAGTFRLIAALPECARFSGNRCKRFAGLRSIERAKDERVGRRRDERFERERDKDGCER